MACNCTTNEQIEKLYQMYGNKVNTSTNETFLFKLKNFFIKIGVSIGVLLALPYVICYIIYHGFFKDGKISLAHFYGLRDKVVK